MYDKYETKTYPEYFQLEDSDTETEKIKSTLKTKKATHTNEKKFFQPDFFFTKEKKNISFYQSDSRGSSYKERKYKSLNKKLSDTNYDSDVIYMKSSYVPANFIEEQFSYNYINTEENNENINKSNITSSNKRICLDSISHNNNYQVPQRTIKTYQNQFDVEKSDNFNVLSYRPEDYESDCMKTDSKSKIIQFFKKEDAGELFYPSKRAKSPLSPLSSINSTEKKENLLSYQTPTLKFQSFFGSYTKPTHFKNNNQTKSTSKIKKNQLEDFNIDKLIEIGDNFSNKWNNILSFGKKIKNIKNKHKNNLNYYSENEKNKTKKNTNSSNGLNNQKGNLLEITKISPQKKENEEEIVKNIIDNQEKKIMRKKIVYHGQIKRKKNIKNDKPIVNNKNKDMNTQNKLNEDINKNLNIDNEKKELNINNDINNNQNNNEIKNKNKFKKINTKSNFKEREYIFKQNKENPIYNQITPKKSLPKKKINLNSNDKVNYSINKYPIKNNITEANKYNALTNKENNAQKEVSKNIISAQTDINSNNKNINQPINQTSKRSSLKKNNNEENSNKKYNKNSYINTTTVNNNNNNQTLKKINDKGFKNKNYYGYDERHNLEGTINNHSYYVSVYSRKKINQKNNSIDKIN